MLTIVTGSLPAKNENHHQPSVDPSKIDRVADHLLQHGYRHQAERLAHLAQAVREAGR